MKIKMSPFAFLAVLCASAVPVFSFAGGLEAVADLSQAARGADSIESARGLSGQQIDSSLSLGGQSSPVYAGQGAGPVKSKARLSSRSDGGAPNSKTSDVPESVGAAVSEYLEPRGAVTDFLGGLLGSVGGSVVGMTLMEDRLNEHRVSKWFSGMPIIALPVTLPLFVAGLLVVAVGSALAGFVVGTGLGVVKVGQAVVEAVQGKF